MVAALALGGCGGDDSGGETTREDVLGSLAALAQCSDWNGRTEDERLATIENIREQINLEQGPVQTPALDDERAYELFENACSEPGAATHRLYVIYARAAGFASLLDE